MDSLQAYLGLDDPASLQHIRDNMRANTYRDHQHNLSWKTLRMTGDEEQDSLIRRKYEAMHALQQWVSEHNTSSDQVVPTSELLVLDDCVALSSPWMSGRHTVCDKRHGQSLAWLHGVLAGYPHPTTMPTFVDAHKAISEPQSLIGKRIQVDLGEQYPYSLSSFWPDQVVHGDAYHVNVLRDGDVCRWLDFELSCYGPREWDLGEIWIACHMMGKGDWTALVEGYAQTPDEYEYLMGWDQFSPWPVFSLFSAADWALKQEQDSPEWLHEKQVREQWWTDRELPLPPERQWSTI